MSSSNKLKKGIKMIYNLIVCHDDKTWEVVKREASVLDNVEDIIHRYYEEYKRNNRKDVPFVGLFAIEYENV